MNGFRLYLFIGLCLYCSGAMAGKFFFFTESALNDTHNSIVDMILAPAQEFPDKLWAWVGG